MSQVASETASWDFTTGMALSPDGARAYVAAQSAGRDSSFDAALVAWDDPSADWDAPIPTLLRSTWNYALDVGRFLSWVDRVSAVAPLWSEGSGGIGAVSTGLAELVIELVGVAAPLIVSFRLTRASGAGGWGKALWRTHVVVTIALVAALFIGSWPVTFLVLAIFLPVQVFFANAALAMWIATRQHVDRRGA